MKLLFALHAQKPVGIDIVREQQRRAEEGCNSLVAAM